jgi:hypothetical protein
MANATYICAMRDNIIRSA